MAAKVEGGEWEIYSSDCLYATKTGRDKCFFYRNGAEGFGTSHFSEIKERGNGEIMEFEVTAYHACMVNWF